MKTYSSRLVLRPPEPPPAYVAEVHRLLLESYGVPAPDGLARLVAESCLAHLTAAQCVAAIGVRFGLELLPPRAARH